MEMRKPKTFKFMTAKKDIDAGIAVFNHLKKDRLVVQDK
jgi:hypothetical protein